MRELAQRFLGVDQQIQEVRRENRETNQRLEERIDILLKRTDSRFMWMMTTMIAMSGAIIASVRL